MVVARRIFLLIESVRVQLLELRVLASVGDTAAVSGEIIVYSKLGFRLCAGLLRAAFLLFR